MTSHTEMKTEPEPMQFVDSELAFAGAIEDGYLSDDPTAPNFAGDYMYMHTTTNPTRPDGFRHIDHFKHIISRRYLTVPCDYLTL